MYSDYDNMYLWDIPREWNIGTEELPLRIRIKDMPRKDRVDFSKIINSDYGNLLISNMKPYILYKDEMDAELLEYYRSIGLNKKIYNREKLYEKWALYTPISLEKPANKDKHYPVLFINHGACMPIHWEESTGYLPIAGKEELIVISAQNHNSDNLMKILDFVEGKYNVDKSRVYLCGYSQGGMQSLMCAYRNPTRITAMAPCGSPLSLPDQMLPAQLINNAIGYDIPGITICGQEESLEYFPANLDNVSLDIMGPDRHGASLEADPTLHDLFNPKLDVIPKTAEAKIRMYNKRRTSMRLNEIPFDRCIDCKNSSNEVERMHGFPADETNFETIYGVRHFTSILKNDKDMNICKIISVEGQPHWPIATMPQIAWDYMKHFVRDVKTKEIIIV